MVRQVCAADSPDSGIGVLLSLGDPTGAPLCMLCTDAIKVGLQACDPGPKRLSCKIGVVWERCAVPHRGCMQVLTSCGHWRPPVFAA